MIANRVAARTHAAMLQQTRNAHVLSPLLPKIEQFNKDVQRYLPADGNRVAFASAWLATDNVFVALMHEHHPKALQGLSLVAIDTMHLFPETLQCAEEMQAKYGKKALLYTPKGISTREEFEALHGHCEEMSHADFDFVSKVEPFSRALKEVNKDILITGRRMDQGNERIELPIWEEDKRIMNPLANWSWSDITTFVDYKQVPYNKRHHMVFRCAKEIPAVERHLENLPWTPVDLGKPYWQATPAEIKGDAQFAYISKSFGDVHSSVPVFPHESERAGRFVRQGKSECGIHTRTNHVGQAHGGGLVNLMVTDEKVSRQLINKTTKAIELNERQACDVWNLVHGAFSPLKGFLGEADYTSVVEEMRLKEKQLWSMPVTFDMDDVSGLVQGHSSLLLKWKGEAVAVLEVESVYAPNKAKEALNVYGTTSVEHPTVNSLIGETGKYYVGGRIHGINGGPKFEYATKTPAEVRAELPKNGESVIAFQNRNPIHRAHYELLVRAKQDVANAHLLVHPTCGPTQPGDIEGKVRIATYEAVEEEAKKQHGAGFHWAYLPYSMKMAGPREAIMHMTIRKNFGATHFIIGRDMAGTKSTLSGDDFYGPYDAMEMGSRYADELGMKVVSYENMVYAGEELGYLPESDAKKGGHKIVKLSGTEFRRRLRSGEDIPEWFSFPSVVGILRKAGDDAFCV